VLEDFTGDFDKPFLADGFAFGDGPAQPGDIRIGADPAAPIARVIHTPGVHRDPDWKGLKYAAGRQTGSSSLDKFMRPGQTFRTDTFVIESENLWYLVRGAGYAYLNVDSHHMVRGPLHGKLVNNWRDDTPGALRWVQHGSTKDYIGHNAHIEFTPMGDEDMAVLMVVESDSKPAIPLGANGLLLNVLTRPAPLSVEDLARQYRRLFSDINRQLGAGRIDSRDAAQLADWLVRKLDLFAPRNGAFRELLHTAAQNEVEDHRRLVGSIRRESSTAMAIQEGSGVNEHVLIRGSQKSIGPVAPRQLLEAIAGDDQSAPQVGSGRMAWVQRMLDDANPYPARVMVNRIWRHLTGRGIVASVDNFGVLGQRPTHPELLDWLADDFRTHGWSLKHAIKTVMLSSTYRMDSKPAAATPDVAMHIANTDPDNLLLHRMRVKRLEGEVIRDSILQLSGRLDRTLYGVSIPVHLTAFMEGRGRPKQSGPLDGAGRRSIYTAIRRNFLPNMMLAFDMPIPFNAMGRRSVSNVPAQALILMNDPFVIDQANLWAKRLLAMKELDNNDARVRQLYRMAFARDPQPQELAQAVAFVDEQAGALAGSSKADPQTAAWTDLCHVVMNVKEFIFIR
jgi:hypothetical protein